MVCGVMGLRDNAPHASILCQAPRSVESNARQETRMTSPSLHEPRAVLRHLYDVAVQRALPLHNTAARLPSPPRGRTLVLGAGKAGGAMAQAVETLWPADAPLSGLVVTR
jgi:hydroxypyruvate reductase